MRKLWQVPFLAVMALGMSLTGAACGGGDGGGDDGGDETGSVTVAMTDGATDDIDFFQVDITGITMRKASGANVSVLSGTYRVDLVSLSDLSQVLQTLQLPTGIYTSGVFTMNFTTAQARLIGESTDAALLNYDGTGLTGTVNVNIDFGSGPLVIVAGRNKILEFDFDLDNSISVIQAGDPDPAGGTVGAGGHIYMEPTVTMRVDRSDQKELFVAGELGSVDTSGNTFVVDFITPSGATLSSVTCAVNGSTVYQVDGNPSTGSLSVLAALSAGTSIQAYGSVNSSQRRMDVNYVEAGHGTALGGDDFIEGYVLTRSSFTPGQDADLTVLGRGVDYNTATTPPTVTSVSLNTSFTVSTTFAGTGVVRRASAVNYDTDDLSPGQLVRIYGTLSGSNMSGTSVVRMQPTRVAGVASAAASGGTLNIDLQKVGLRNISNFDVGGTVNDLFAIASSFDLDVSTSGSAGATNGTEVAGWGFFTSIDDVSGDEFVCSSLVDLSTTPAFMTVQSFINPSSTALDTITTSQITLSVTSPLVPGYYAKGISGLQSISNGNVTVVPPGSGFVLYGIVSAGTGQVQLFFSFADFATELQNRKNAGDRLWNFSMGGAYDETGRVATASLAVAILE